MRKILFLIVLALGGIYGVGFVSLGEGGANRFLNKMEELTTEGSGKALCDLFTDDAQVDINDHTAGRKGKITGGKEEICAYFKAAAPAMALLQTSTQLQRRDFAVKRDWLHPWTVQVTYTEFRSTSIPRAGISINTESDDELVLVRTLAGVKISRLKTEIFAQEE
jgi:hypothetical protein